MSSTVCVDSSLALDWLLPTENSEAIDRLWLSWKVAGIGIVVPPLFHVEVTSVIRRLVHSKRLLSEEGEILFLEYVGMQVETIDYTDVPGTAWKLARRFNLPSTCEMQYLAVAELEDCELWTADRKLVDALRGKSNRVKWVGNLTGEK
jgi:predicted nucleic acid-binding protein